MELPSRFGKYELLERIATGGMAEVFLARSFGVEGFEKRLVIKRILPDLAKNPRFVSMFVREAKISASLNHPNIVQVFDFGKNEGDHYIAMEHMLGRDLTRTNKRLRQNGRRMPMDIACYVAASLLRGLGYAHARTGADGLELNIVHRDVSPHNVMLSFQGEVKLFDFGIARLVPDAATVLPMPGGGKYAYMAPEQARGEAIDRRSDIFSAGIVLYELLVGHRLFQDADPAKKLEKVQNAIVLDPREEVPEIPESLWNICQRLLALNPADRFQRAEMAEEELRALMFQEGMMVDTPRLGDFLKQTFEGDIDVESDSVDLEGLAADLTQLDGEAHTDVIHSHHGEGTPTTAPVAHMVPHSEKRSVVVVACEVCGFTELSERLDPEDLVRRHVRYLRRVRRVVERYDGFVESFKDEAFVVFFGVPRASEHDVDKALACALDLVTMTDGMRAEGLALGLGVGVHQGEITVGPQSGRDFRYMAVGNTMKLATRLSGEAEVAEVLVSEHVAEFAAVRWRFETHAPLRRRKGASEVVPQRLTGRHRVAIEGKGRWLRRGAELEILRDSLRRLGEGQGSLVAIHGDTGTGKSRLVTELRHLAKKRGVPMLVGRCTPYSDRPLTPLREIISQFVGIDASATTKTLRKGLERLAILGFTAADAAVMGMLFGLETPEDLSRDAIVRAVNRMLVGLVEDRPVILAMEDVEHLSRTECEILGRVVRTSRNTPILFLFTSSEPLPKALGSPDERILLAKLSKTDQRALVAEMLGATKVSSALSQLVYRTAEGNPLYMEAMVKALHADIVLEGGEARLQDPDADPKLPPGLEALIAARLDALEPASKGALQIAAIIGSTFSLALLAESAGIDDPGPLVGDLEAHGLVAQTSDGRFSFSSHLVLEVVRRSSLGVQRRDYHRMVAAGISRLYSDNIEPYRLELAEHCAQAGRALDAARHASKAGDTLRKQQFLERAAAVWDRGIAWIRQAERADADPEACTVGEALLRLKSGEAHALLGNPLPANKNLQLALDIAEGLADAEIEARSLMGLGRLHLSAGKTELAKMHLEAACAASEGRPWGREVAVQAREALGMLAYDAGDIEESDKQFEAAMALAGNDDVLAARALLGLSARDIRVGNELAAMELLGRARTLAADAGDRILLGRIINNVGIVHLCAGRHEPALSHFREALRIREGLGYTLGIIINLHNIGDVYLRMGDEARAWAAFEKSRALSREAQWERGIVMNDAFLVYLEGQRGSHERPTQRLREILDQARSMSDAETEVIAGWLLGRLLARRERTPDALEALDQALDVAQRIDDRGMIDIIQRTKREYTGGQMH